MKKCTKCGIRKNVVDFHKDKTTRDGNSPNCKSCRQLSQKIFYNNLRKLVIKHYGNKCQCCGEKEYGFLTFEHKEGGGLKQKREIGWGRAFIKWIIANNYPDSIEILCYNCNCSKGVIGKCPHKK
jgi:hypothetical protein